MSVGRMIQLQEGDVVSMKIDGGVKIKVEDNPIFRGKSGRLPARRPL